MEFFVRDWFWFIFYFCVFMAFLKKVSDKILEEENYQYNLTQVNFSKNSSHTLERPTRFEIAPSLKYSIRRSSSDGDEHFVIL